MTRHNGMHLTRQWQLLFDDLFLDRAKGVQLCMNAPVQHPEPVLVPDRPWEAQGICGYNTVLREADGRFRLWYGAMMKTGLPSEGAIRLCYAESEDGLSWRKPNLGLIPFRGSRDNNVVAPTDELQSQQGATVYRDDEAPEAERYKLWTKFRPSDAQCAAGWISGLYAMHSPDGIHWSLYPDQPNPRSQMCDTQNMFFRDPRAGGWAGYTRVTETQHIDEAAEMGRGRYRTVGRITSPDFKAWSSTAITFEADDEDRAIPLPVPKVGPRPPLDVYTNCAMPYPGAQDAYLMFPSIYYHWGEGEAPAALDVQLATSRDGIRWRRAGERRPFLRHGFDGAATSGMLYANPWLVPAGNEWWLYYCGTSRRHVASDGTPKQSGLFRASIRRDGFVSVDAGYGGGEFTTPPMTFEGSRLEVNVEGSAGGWMKVEVLDGAGKALPGYGFDDAEVVMGNSLCRSVSWKGNPALPVGGQPVRLRFVMRDVKFYAFRVG